MGPKYPGVQVILVGRNGNALAIIGAVVKALKREGLPAEEVEAFRVEALSGDYDHLLRTCTKWVTVE